MYLRVFTFHSHLQRHHTLLQCHATLLALVLTVCSALYTRRYTAVQVGAGKKRAKRFNKAQLGHFAKYVSLRDLTPLAPNLQATRCGGTFACVY